MIHEELRLTRHWVAGARQQAVRAGRGPGGKGHVAHVKGLRICAVDSGAV